MLCKRIVTAGCSVALLGLVVSTGGCLHMPSRHGVILRGDWSLELNRAPWLAGRESSYQESSSEPPLFPPDPGIDCAPPMMQPMQAAPPVLEIPRAMGVYETDYAPPCDTGPCPPGSRVLNILAQLKPKFLTVEQPEAVGYYNHPRFHPLPIGPVFSPAPMEELLTPPVEPAAESAPARAPEPPSAHEVNTSPEMIPAPAPTPTRATSAPATGSRWEARGSGGSVTNKRPSWVFTPDESKPAPLPPNQYVHSQGGSTAQ